MSNEAPAGVVPVAAVRAPAELREQLRGLMSDCPSCVPSNADDVPDVELAAWIRSHGADPCGLEAE